MSGTDVAKLCWYLLEYPRTTAALHLDSTCKESLAQLLIYSSQYASQLLLQPLSWQSRSSWIHSDDFGVSIIVAYQRTPTLAFPVRRVLQLPSLPVCHGTSNNDFYSLQCKASPGSPLGRSYRALTAVTPSIPCASGHHYATRSKSDTNTEEEEIIWSIFMSNACQSGHGSFRQGQVHWHRSARSYH